MKIYAIHHSYGVDGGFGDYVDADNLISVVSTKEEAIRWCKKHERPEIYDRPYDDLDCGTLYVEEIEVMDHLHDIENPDWHPWHCNIDVNSNAKIIYKTEYIFED